MARTEPSNINHCIASSITSPIVNNNFIKDSIQRNDEIKTEFTLREGTYKISSLIDNLGKIGTNTCLNEQVKITLLSRIQTICDTNSQLNSRRSSSTNENSIEQKQLSLINENELNQPNDSIFLTDILVFNVGRELIVYEFAEATQPNFGEPIDHRVYKQNHQPTCHDIIQNPNTNVLHILVGFSKGQIQYINMQTKEQKVFNEGSYLDKTKVTCIKWLPSPQTYFIASYSSGYLYVYDEQLNYQRDTNIQSTYSTIKDDEKNFSISYTKNKSKQTRNPISRWSIGSGSINEFAFSPDNILLAVVSQDGFLRIFNYEKMELVAYMKSYFGGLLCVCWSPDGKYIATGGEDDFITLFSLDHDEHTSRVICRGHGHTSWINSISFDSYMNAKTYYSSFIQPSSYNDNDNDGIKNLISYTHSDTSYCDTNIPSLFYRIGSVGQDNRLCLWDITEDILKINLNSKQNSLTYPLISSSSSPSSSTIISNGYTILPSDIITNTQTSTIKSSFSSITSRLSFVRHSNKINKTIDDTSDLTLITQSNGSSKKSRKLPLFLHTSSGTKSLSSKLTTTTTTTTTSDDTNQNSLSTQINNNNLSSRQTNFDLTKSTFGTNLCPKLDDIQVIEPIITEFISHERLNGIYFGENYLITSSQDGLITIWEKPQKLLNINTTDDRTMSSTTLINSNSHHSTVSQRL